MQNIIRPVVLSLVLASAGFSQSYTIKTFAGGGDETSPDSIGDNGTAINSLLLNPTSIAIDHAGEVYIVDSDHSRVRKVADGVITTVAGTGVPGYSGDNGPATSAQLNH